MSKFDHAEKFVDVYALWVEYEATDDAVAKKNLARQIAEATPQRDRAACVKLNEELRAIVRANEFFVINEFYAFVIQEQYTEIFHLFFVDEDSLLIDAAYGLKSEEVVEAFKRMTVLTAFEPNELYVARHNNPLYADYSPAGLSLAYEMMQPMGADLLARALVAYPVIASMRNALRDEMKTVARTNVASAWKLPN